jgi:hypothetical protein
MRRRRAQQDELDAHQQDTEPDQAGQLDGAGRPPESLAEQCGHGDRRGAEHDRSLVAEGGPPGGVAAARHHVRERVGEPDGNGIADGEDSQLPRLAVAVPSDIHDSHADDAVDGDGELSAL